jgi:predicted nucleic acid-binding protein
VKRYVEEPGGELLRQAMRSADRWFTCRVTFVEVVRAVGMIGGWRATRAVREDWAAFEVVEIDQRLAEAASELALKHGLRSLDALHLAAALVLKPSDPVVATWDKRLHAAAGAEGLEILPL